MSRGSFSARWLVAVVVAIVSAGSAAPASGAVTVGSNFISPAGSGSCVSPGFECTAANAVLPLANQAAGGTVASIDGVITSWRLKFGSAPVATAGVRLRVIRGSTAVGGGAVEDPANVSGVQSFGARLPVRTGDLIGVNLTGFTGSGAFVFQSTPGATDDVWIPPLGETETRTPGASSFEVLIQADIEPDCDSDGFGDETQDADLSSCNPSPPPGDTAAPDTTITEHPKDKTKKKTATFEFTSTEPGSTFECSLDGEPFSPCTSPVTEKVKKGKHNFQVRARDAAGNVDGSPAFDSWKFKKKK